MVTKPAGTTTPSRRAPKPAPSATHSTGAIIGAAAAGVIAGVVAGIGRKAMVQAPSALAGDWLEAVKTEHKLALALFDAIQATDDSQTVKRTMLLVQLKHALGKHALMEENAIYPALRDSGEPGDADELNHEHGYVKQYLYDLGNMPKNSLGFLAKIADFRRDIEEHIRDEEDRIFPSLHAKLGDEKNRSLTAAANREGFKLA